ncbi:MAG TPA: 3-oxoacyl-ACP reductase FabG [Pseudonocardia sp.]|nr:3-oxoacyl-ACP reductase FabG [Pseudonocardia sp.]
MSADLTGARALVTGAGHGIGRAIAVALAAAGADVAVHYGKSAEGAEETAAAITAQGRKAKTFAGDVRDAAQVNAFVGDAVEFLGGLDVLVTNAGHLIGRSKVAEMTDEHWHNVIDVNLTSTFLTCRAALPALVESGGRVVTMASVASHNGGGPGAVAYAAAKAGVVGFTKGLAREVGPQGVTVTAVAPGFIGGTAFHDTFTAPEAQAGIVGTIPVGRGGTPEDVAAAVVYLASPDARFASGGIIDLTGAQWTR